jgi:hypothetical protein
MPSSSSNHVDTTVYVLILIVVLTAVTATIIFIPERMLNQEEISLVDRLILRLPELLLICFTGITAVIAWRTHRENQKSTLLKLYNDVIEKHHSTEITELRREGYKALRESCPAAAQEGVTLSQYDRGAAIKVSRLANYYESLGMLLEASWSILPQSTRRVMKEMLHHNVSRFWPLYCEYIDTIRLKESRAIDYANSFEWLYNQVKNFTPVETKFDSESREGSASQEY